MNTFVQFFKRRILALRNRNLIISGGVNILGALPYMKIPKNGLVRLEDNSVINSDFKESNIALSGRCKFVTGYEGKITVGQNSQLNGVCLVAYEAIEIGKDCQISSATLIADTDFHPKDSSMRRRQLLKQWFPFSSVAKEKIFIGNNVWIGWNATILKGVNIGDDSIVAAGSVVLKGEYPKRSLIGGNPAKVIKSL